MRQITRNPSIWLGGLELPINVTPETGQGCYVEMLEAMHSQMHAALTIHRRVMVLRLTCASMITQAAAGTLLAFLES